MLGLVGSHRVGKTTLAKTYAEETASTFVNVDVAGMVREIGYDPSHTGGYDFDTRMEIQEHILDSMGRVFAAHVGSAAITDRTPLDAMLYTLSIVGAHTCNEQQSRWLKEYMDRCFDMTNRYFTVLLAIQPGIPLVESDKSAPANAAYIEHLNSLALGFISDERLAVPHYYMPRHIQALDTRIAVAKRAVQRALAIALSEKEESLLH